MVSYVKDLLDLGTRCSQCMQDKCILALKLLQAAHALLLCY